MTQTIGSRRQVWNGTAKKTSGGLTKTDLMMSHGHIVSKAKHITAKKEMRLLKYGYGTQKGKFGFVKVGTKNQRKGHKKMKGGSGYAQLSPANVDAKYMIQDVVPQNFNSLARSLVGGAGRRMSGGAMSLLEPAEFGSTAVGGLVSDVPVIGLTTAGSNEIQFAAGQAGGRRRSSSRGRGRGRGKSMRGGTTKHSLMGAPLDGPQNLSLNRS